MSTKVTGKNIMLYSKIPNGIFYFNGGVSEGTILTKSYYQLSGTKNAASAANFTLADSGTIARFITDVNSPGASSLVGGDWTFSYYADITYSLDYAPAIYFKISKYNGTTLTTIATGSNVPFTSNSKTLYTSTVTVPTTAISSTDRIVVEVITVNIGARDVTFYTQGDSVAQVLTTLPLDVPFACSTGCTFQVQVAQREVTSQTSAWYKEFKNDIASWTVSCEGIVTINGWNYTNMLQVQQSRTPVAIEFVVDNGADGLTVISGTCNLTSLQLNGPYKDIATYSVSLQGSGAYIISGTQAATGGIVVKGGTVYYKHYDPAGGETTITWTDMIGKDCVYVSRGGVNSKQIITSGTPTSEQVKWNASTGVLTFGRALNSQDFVNALFS